jgi:mycofactocin glycosyltransferase
MKVPLLPDQLRSAWEAVVSKQHSYDEFSKFQEKGLEAYRRIWQEALLLPGEEDLKHSLVVEISDYLGCDDLEVIQRHCERGASRVANEWNSKVDLSSSRSIEAFYDQSEAYVYDLMWWHTLVFDTAPLAYVLAMQFAKQRGCRRYLDFGSGVGGGAILFAASGFNVAMADISSTLLKFSQWRLNRRNVSATSIDLKTSKLPDDTFDIITAMDVFEHLVDPTRAVEQLWLSLKTGGFLFGRFHAECDVGHPQHIITDFSRTLARMRELGLAEVWRDEWLWGHQVFQKMRSGSGCLRSEKVEVR